MWAGAHHAPSGHRDLNQWPLAQGSNVFILTFISRDGCNSGFTSNQSLSGQGRNGMLDACRSVHGLSKTAIQSVHSLSAVILAYIPQCCRASLQKIPLGAFVPRVQKWCQTQQSKLPIHTWLTKTLAAFSWNQFVLRHSKKHCRHRLDVQI